MCLRCLPQLCCDLHGPFSMSFLTTGTQPCMQRLSLLLATPVLHRYRACAYECASCACRRCCCTCQTAQTASQALHRDVRTRVRKPGAGGATAATRAASCGRPACLSCSHASRCVHYVLCAQRFVAVWSYAHDVQHACISLSTTKVQVTAWHDASAQERTAVCSWPDARGSRKCLLAGHLVEISMLPSSARGYCCARPHLHALVCTGAHAHQT